VTPFLAVALSTALAGPLTPSGAPVPVTLEADDRTEQRWRVGEVRVVLTKSPGPDELPTAPRCAASGVDLTVDGDPGPDEAAVIDAACRRLVFDAPALVSKQARFVPSPDPRLRIGMRGVAAVWLAALAFGFPRGRAAAAWLVAALAVRLVAPSPWILMGVAYPYERMLVYAGLKADSALYGAGWPALLDLVRPVLGASPERLHLAHLGASALTVPLVGATAARLTQARSAGHAAAAVACVLPHAVHLAWTEEAFVVAALLHAAALAGLARPDSRGVALAAASAALLAHVRPDQLPVAALLVGLLVLRRAVGPAAVAGGIVALRVLTLPHAEAPYPPEALLRALAHPAGPGTTTLLLDPWVTPAWLMPAAAVGVFAGPRGARTLALPVALAAWLPYWGYGRHTDLLRFVLPATVSFAVLAGLGVSVLLAGLRGVVARVALGTVGAGGLVLAARPGGGPMVHAVEHDLLRRHACALGPGAVVRYDPTEDPQGGTSRWLDAVCGVRLVPLDGPPPPGSWLWIGRAHRSPGGSAVPSCEGEAVFDTTTPPYNGGLHPLGTEPVRLALLRVTRCR
jgi:hypothetical protein